MDKDKLSSILMLQNFLKPQVQYQIDITLSKFGKASNYPEWSQVTQQINKKFMTNYSPNEIIERYEGLMQDLSKQKIICILKQFQQWKINFQIISQNTNASIYQIKRQIMKVLVNNIWKVCFIVRKRKISTLKNNFISNRAIKELVVLMLKPDSFKVLLDEYNQLWKLISQYYEDSHFQNIKDQIYKLVYRELIILTEKFKIGTDIEAESDLPAVFEKNILARHRNENQMKPQSMCSFIEANLKKKKTKQTINLVSDEEMSDSGEHFEVVIQDRESERQSQLQIKIKILRQIAITRLTLDNLSQLQNSYIVDQDLKRQIALLVVRLAILQTYL